MVPSSSYPSFPYPPKINQPTANVSPSYTTPTLSSFLHNALLTKNFSPNNFPPMNENSTSAIFSPMQKTLVQQLGHHGGAFYCLLTLNTKALLNRTPVSSLSPTSCPTVLPYPLLGSPSKTFRHFPKQCLSR